MKNHTSLPAWGALGLGALMFLGCLLGVSIGTSLDADDTDPAAAARTAACRTWATARPSSLDDSLKWTREATSSTDGLFDDGYRDAAMADLTGAFGVARQGALVPELDATDYQRFGDLARSLDVLRSALDPTDEVLEDGIDPNEVRASLSAVDDSLATIARTC